jgi:hypothetical protein
MLSVIYQHKMMNVKLYHEFGDVIEKLIMNECEELYPKLL